MTLRATFLFILMLTVPSIAETGASKRFVVDNDRSWIRVLVYRAGLMSRLGHNHVISSNDISGVVEYSDELADSVVNISFPVESLIVDNAELRDLEGEDFPGQLPDKDIEKTHTNMLGQKLLDAETNPSIRIQTTSVEGTVDSLLVTASATVAGRTNSIQFSASAITSGDEITILGSARISHADLGLKPYSAAFGLLKVQQEMTIRFRFTAELDDTPEIIRSQGELPQVAASIGGDL